MKSNLKRFGLMLAGFLVGGLIVVVAGAGFVVGAAAGVSYVGVRVGFQAAVEGLTKRVRSEASTSNG